MQAEAYMKAELAAEAKAEAGASTKYLQLTES